MGITVLAGGQAKALGVKSGILIMDVLNDSPADKAGLRGTVESPDGDLRLGDIIIQFDGKDIKTEQDFFKVLDTKEVGQTATVKALRTEVTASSNGDDEKIDEIRRFKIDAQVELRERPNTRAMSSSIKRELDTP